MFRTPLKALLNRSAFLMLLSSPLVPSGSILAQETSPAAPSAIDAQDPTGETKKALDGLVGEVKKLKGLKVTGFFQTRFELDQTSSDGIKDDGRTLLNKDQFSVRRAHLKTSYTGIPYSEVAMQINATGAGISLLDAEVSLLSPWKEVTGRLTVGQMVIPFGAEIPISNRDLEVPERATVVNRLFPGIRDRGALLNLQWKFLRLATGVFNGNGIQDTATTYLYQTDKDGNGTIDEGEEGTKSSAAINFGNTDRDHRKDFFGRAGVDFGVVSAGVSGYVGQWGKIPTLIATTDAETAITTYAGGDAVTYIPKTRYGADLTVGVPAIKPLGKTILRAEFIQGHGIFAGADEKDTDARGWIATLVQNLGPKAMAAVRVDQFDPDLASEEDTILAIEPAIHLFPTPALRLTLAYQILQDFDQKDDAGNKTDKANSHLTVQLQGRF